MVKSIVNEYKFSPFDVGNMFIDDYDELGLVFWYNEVKEISAKLNKK